MLFSQNSIYKSCHPSHSPHIGFNLETQTSKSYIGSHEERVHVGAWTNRLPRYQEAWKPWCLP